MAMDTFYHTTYDSRDLAASRLSLQDNDDGQGFNKHHAKLNFAICLLISIIK